MGVVVRRYIDFLILFITTLLLSVLASLLFVHFKNVFCIYADACAGQKSGRPLCGNAIYALRNKVAFWCNVLSLKPACPSCNTPRQLYCIYN